MSNTQDPKKPKVDDKDKKKKEEGLSEDELNDVAGGVQEVHVRQGGPIVVG
jgi:hypothetical protein